MRKLIVYDLKQELFSQRWRYYDGSSNVKFHHGAGVDKWFWNGEIKVNAIRHSSSFSLNCFLPREACNWIYISVIYHANLLSFLTFTFWNDRVSDIPYKPAQSVAILYCCISISHLHDLCPSIVMFFHYQETQKRYFFLKKLYIFI